MSAARKNKEYTTCISGQIPQVHLKVAPESSTAFCNIMQSFYFQIELEVVNLHSKMSPETPNLISCVSNLLRQDPMYIEPA